MRIAFWNTSSFVGSVRNAEILEHLVAESILPAVVITAPAREPSPSLAQSPIKTAATALGIPVLEPASLKDFAAEFRRHGIELSVVASYGKIIPADLLGVPKHRSLNIHPSLLPRWRGPTPIQATIRAGDAATGVTIILMDEKMDHGPIVAKAEYEIQNSKITAPELARELAGRGGRLLAATLPDWIAGRIRPQPQDDTKATYSKMLRREDGRIDWKNSATGIERMARAYAPWPGSYTFWHAGEKTLRLHMEAADVLPQNREQPLVPGRVSTENRILAVGTGKGVLLVRRIKAEGGPAMDAAAFCNGHPAINGATLE